MALELKTQVTQMLASDIPARAPLPDDALALVDFTTGLQITQSDVRLGRAGNTIFNRSNSVSSSGWFYGSADIEMGSANFWDRIEYDADGRCLGLLMDGTQTQTVIRSHRTDLSLGTLTGAVLAAVTPAPAEAAAQWWELTPTGAGEASLQLATGSVTNFRLLVSFEIRTAGGRYAQIGTRAGDANAWANIDLVTGEVTARGANVQAAARRRPGGGWTFYAITRKIESSLPDLQPYVASVASSDTGKLGLSGGAIQVRAPIVRTRNGEGLVPGAPYANASADSRNADVLYPQAALHSLSADFTCVFRARSGWAPSQLQAGLFSILTSGDPVQIRFRTDNTLAIVRSSESSVLAELPLSWEPDTIYRVGVSRQGNSLAVIVNGHAVEVEHADISGMTGWRLLRCNDQATGGWYGHAQKIVLWAGGRRPSELAAMVERWV